MNIYSKVYILFAVCFIQAIAANQLEFANEVKFQHYLLKDDVAATINRLDFDTLYISDDNDLTIIQARDIEVSMIMDFWPVYAIQKKNDSLHVLLLTHKSPTTRVSSNSITVEKVCWHPLNSSSNSIALIYLAEKSQNLENERTSETSCTLRTKVYPLHINQENSSINLISGKIIPVGSTNCYNAASPQLKIDINEMWLHITPTKSTILPEQKAYIGKYQLQEVNGICSLTKYE